MSGETANFHARYLYRDYLQVAECDLTGETLVVVRSYIWDPSEPEATRVLSMTRWEANGTQEKEHLYCMHDAMKNVTSLFGEARGRRALYEYRSYGGLLYTCTPPPGVMTKPRGWKRAKRMPTERMWTKPGTPSTGLPRKQTRAAS